MKTLILIMFALPLLANSQVNTTTSLPFHESILKDDLLRILQKASLPEDSVKSTFSNNGDNAISVTCSASKITIQISSNSSERTSTFYKGVKELGFLFPHPRLQISPTLKELKNKCGKTWYWRPALKDRGFHLHTLHPNEWVSAFYENNPKLAEDFVRWLARNGQNVLDLSLLRVPLSQISQNLKAPFELAQKFQIKTGVSLGIALQQQKSYKLLSLWDSYFGFQSDDKIKEGLENLIKSIPLSFVVLEAGSSEFTPTDFEKTLHWLNLAGDFLQSKNITLFTKVHVSSNQHSKKWGNFNFLPHHANKNVGILPHTVMFYGLLDPKAPMYGNEDFSGIKNFMLKEKDQRPTWYYPETSYWVGMDMDVPLFLTDYLKTRAQDLSFLKSEGITGMLNFSSGEALGYWLFDWNLSLMNDLDYDFNPLTGLSLLGEDLVGWRKILDYQSKWYKGKGLISLLSSANLQDELTKKHRIHERKTMKELADDPKQIEIEVKLLKDSLIDFPSIDFIRSKELKDLLELTKLRQEHALKIRQGLFTDAEDLRKKATLILSNLSKLESNYPELPLFKEWKNSTSYQFGYLYPAMTLYFWEREERQLRESSFFPFKKNLYDFWNILF